MALLKQRRVERIILSRPAVEAGERLGFLPGDLKEKVDPYLRPLYDALQDMLPEGKLQQRIETGQIEIAPLAYMRGRTLSNAYVILDEAQNTTPSQMKMFLTRLGENSRMVVTGDPTQSDLPPGMPSGLGDAVVKLEALEAVGVVRFDKDDVVRHPLVGEIIDAYEMAARPAARTNGGSAPAPGRGAGRCERWTATVATTIEVTVEAAAWQTAVTDPEELCRRVVSAVSWREAATAGPVEVERRCWPTTPASAALNRDWRGKDRPTNVLSFPAEATRRALAGRAARSWATSSWRWRPCSARRPPTASRWPIISATSWCTARCTCSGYDHEERRRGGAPWSPRDRAAGRARRSPTPTARRRRHEAAGASVNPVAAVPASSA